ncbi:methyltransferase domain-containing protein [Streptomyces kanamyceticus]|uniref:methyltransferase domain-containing protein n=1 Tax=Streptomyces kanamyceticus TaxID=1967 RepID=UPI0037DC31DA
MTLHVQNYERSLERSRTSLTRTDRPRTFHLCDREWDLLDEVFAPVYSPSTGIGLDFLGLAGGAPEPSTRSFLDVGTGTGVIAVQAALAGAERVVALDINHRAVRNADLNARRHGVVDRVRSVHSDMFDGLAPDECFDTVFWSSNYVLAPEGYQYRSVHECAYVDVGYRAHRRFLAEAPERLTPHGRALLHFSTRGDLGALHRIADECGRELRTVAAVDVLEGVYGSDRVEHLLLEVVPAGR